MLFAKDYHLLNENNVIEGNLNVKNRGNEQYIKIKSVISASNQYCTDILFITSLFSFIFILHVKCLICKMSHLLSFYGIALHHILYLQKYLSAL